MLYLNTAKVRKLVAVRRVKKWVQPGATVDLDSTDLRMLGANSVFFVRANAENIKKESAPEKEKAAEPKVDTTESEDAPEEPKETPKEPEMNAKEARKLLKTSLEDMTKARLIEVGEGVLRVNVKPKDKKDNIVKQLLKAAKDKGYAWTLKNI